MVDLADAAEDVGGKGFLRVAAHEDALDVDAGEAVFVLFQVVDEVVADVAAQQHRHAGRQFEFFVHRLAQLRQRRVDQFAELLELGVLAGFVFGQLLRADLEGEADPVGDEDVPLAVEDVAARGADPEFAGAVVVGLGQVFVAVEDLQEPEPEEEDPEQRQRDAAEDRDAQRHPGVHLGASLVGSEVHPSPMPPARSASGDGPPAPRPGPGAGCAAPRGRSASRGRRRIRI